MKFAVAKQTGNSISGLRQVAQQLALPPVQLLVWLCGTACTLLGSLLTQPWQFSSLQTAPTSLPHHTNMAHGLKAPAESLASESPRV